MPPKTCWLDDDFAAEFRFTIISHSGVSRVCHSASRKDAHVTLIACSSFSKVKLTKASKCWEWALSDVTGHCFILRSAWCSFHSATTARPSFSDFIYWFSHPVLPPTKCTHWEPYLCSSFMCFMLFNFNVNSFSCENVQPFGYPCSFFKHAI